MSANKPGGICIWDVASGKILHRIAKDCRNVALARNGLSAAVVIDPGDEVEVVDVVTGKRHCQIKTAAWN